MRRLNVYLTHGILVLFFIHAIAGLFQVTGLMNGGNQILGILAYIMLGCIGLHVIISSIFTMQTLFAIKKSGVSYFKENRLFWARRISGFALMIGIIAHLLIFINSGAVVRLHYFGIVELCLHIFLLLCIAVHVLTNIGPAMIGLGAESLKQYSVDILMIISIILMMMAVGFVVYYLRWNTI
ncbi:MAG: hypothetical protein J6E46_06385 [Faecalicoccus sp.]|nr:hypothetical protein [Faecalicoccus sp.]